MLVKNWSGVLGLQCQKPKKPMNWKDKLNWHEVWAADSSPYMTWGRGLFQFRAFDLRNLSSRQICFSGRWNYVAMGNQVGEIINGPRSQIFFFEIVSISRVAGLLLMESIVVTKTRILTNFYSMHVGCGKGVRQNTWEKASFSYLTRLYHSNEHKKLNISS